MPLQKIWAYEPVVLTDNLSREVFLTLWTVDHWWFVVAHHVVHGGTSGGPHAVLEEKELQQEVLGRTNLPTFTA
jgi:hypothetical protein